MTSKTNSTPTQLGRVNAGRGTSSSSEDEFNKSNPTRINSCIFCGPSASDTIHWNDVGKYSLEQLLQLKSEHKELHDMLHKPSICTGDALVSLSAEIHRRQNNQLLLDRANRRHVLEQHVNGNTRASSSKCPDLVAWIRTSSKQDIRKRYHDLLKIENEYDGEEEDDEPVPKRRRGDEEKIVKVPEEKKRLLATAVTLEYRRSSEHSVEIRSHLNIFTSVKGEEKAFGCDKNGSVYIVWKWCNRVETQIKSLAVEGVMPIIRKPTPGCKINDWIKQEVARVNVRCNPPPSVSAGETTPIYVPPKRAAILPSFRPIILNKMIR